jgi:nickel/cobalt transporter (NicO) family protein
MTNELFILLVTAISLAFIHTLAGPDHYLPFIVISKARNWSFTKTSWFTVLCGLGHVGSSILIGFIGIGVGIGLSKLTLIEDVRGSIVSWLFTAFGLVYLAWALIRMLRGRRHNHLHFHSDGTIHLHNHAHQAEHLLVHEAKGKSGLTPWILFTLFVFGPCEPLIPIVMYPAAKHHFTDLIIVTTAFSLVTIGTMLTIVTISFYGIKMIPMRFLEKYTHILAGGTIFLCGMGMLFLGL